MAAALSATGCTQLVLKTSQSSTKAPPLRILVTIAVHGNEPCGVDAANELLAAGLLQPPPNAELTLLVGNPLALARDTRFVDVNLNRVVKRGATAAGSAEHECSLALMAACDRADAWLDIHSTSAASPAYALPAEDAVSGALAAELPVGYVLHEIVHSTPSKGTTGDYALTAKVPFVCVECGQHAALSSVANARAVILAFVDACARRAALWRGGKRQRLAVAPAAGADTRRGGGARVRRRPTQMRSASAEYVREGFRWEGGKRPKAFAWADGGAILARDGASRAVRAPAGGCYVVMPTAMPFVGEEAYFYGFPLEGGGAKRKR